MRWYDIMTYTWGSEVLELDNHIKEIINIINIGGEVPPYLLHEIS